MQNFYHVVGQTSGGRKTDQRFITALGRPWVLVRFGAGPNSFGPGRRPSTALAFLTYDAGAGGLLGGIVDLCCDGPRFRYVRERGFNNSEVVHMFSHPRGCPPTNYEIRKAKRALAVDPKKGD